MVPQEQNKAEIFLQNRAHCINAVAQIMEMRATGAVPLAYVQTYGCQQNVADGEKIKGQLAEMGFSFTENPDEADFILYNTCAVRENAESKEKKKTFFGYSFMRLHGRTRPCCRAH